MKHKIGKIRWTYWRPEGVRPGYFWLTCYACDGWTPEELGEHGIGCETVRRLLPRTYDAMVARAIEHAGEHGRNFGFSSVKMAGDPGA